MSRPSFDTLRSANLTRCEASFHRLDRWSPTDWACALAGEVGEACNEVKKLRRLETNADLESRSAQEIVDALADELADVVIYADLLAARLGIDLGTAVVKKFNRVSERVHSEVRL